MKKVLFYCDKCNKEVEENNIMNISYRDEAPCYNGLPARSYKLDLCRECNEKIVTAIKENQ